MIEMSYIKHNDMFLSSWIY